MGLRLNEIGEQIIVEKLQLITQQIERYERNLPGPAEDHRDRELRHRALGEMLWEAAVLSYQQEQPPEAIRSFLVRSAREWVRMHSERYDLPTEEEWDPRDFEKAFHLAICFGGPEERRTAAGLPEGLYIGEPDDDQPPLLGYLTLLKQHVTGGTPDSMLLAQLIKCCRSDTASKHARKSILPRLQGLRALQTGSQDIWRQSIEGLVRDHEWEATKGEFRLLFDGFLCLPALALAQLGKERGMSCTINSAYLPLVLLEKN